MAQKQQELMNENPSMVDYGYIEYFRKAVANSSNLQEKKNLSFVLLNYETQKDYHSPSLRQINHLIQIDETPYLELQEPRWEIYKISLSLQPNGKFR